MKPPITYPLMVARNFPKGHPRAGEPTGFRDAIQEGSKIHTLRLDYDFWLPRIQKVQEGKAVLSLREWVGRPYGKGSTVEEFLMLSADDGVGIQKCFLYSKPHNGDAIVFEEGSTTSILMESKVIAKNDGLTYEDFDMWFFSRKVVGCNLGIIHFTSFRYTDEGNPIPEIVKSIQQSLDYINKK